jgi:hypothetical protein
MPCARLCGPAALARGGWWKGKVVTVLTCDYNGWNDAPEEEREWFDEHPEVWTPATRDADVRLYRATPRSPVRRFRGGMAA